MATLKTVKCLALAGALVTTLGHAEDIDLFQGGASITGNKPNVMVFVDNSANWNSNAQHWPGGIKQGQSELNALKNVVNGLTGDVRVGLMFFVKGPGNNPDGGYVRFGIRDMSTTNKAALQDILNGIYPNFSDENSGQQVATSNSKYGEGMYEVFQYFSGAAAYAGQNAELRDYAGNGSPTVAPYKAGSIAGNALAGSGTTTYTSPLSAGAPCAKNYLIFIGNGFPSNSSDAPSSYGNANLSSFNATAIYPEGNKTTYADEWSRFLYQNGAVAPCSGDTCANSKIITYTIDVYLDAQDTSETSLLKSMAKVGGGKYFAAKSESEIQAALQAIFNEVQAVSSVFTSASLPVSVNTQGTYLNQIYMGVFRPDATGAPRWLGNLKQYKFGLTTDALGQDTLFLADATGAAAVNPQTGFVSPNAQSYWTTGISPACTTANGTTTPTTDNTRGFWCNSPTGVGADLDLPDGDLVEKGAAGQKLRALGPAARTMYTCTPACSANATPSYWATTNASLVTALSGATSTISNLSRSGTTVTVTTAADLGLAVGDTITISGTSVAAYNAQWTATSATAATRTFTFTVPETPTTPMTNSGITAAAGAAVSQAVAAGDMTMASNIVSVALPAHGFTNGQTVTVSGANVSAAMATATTKCTGYPGSSATCEYNGIFTISVTDADHFSYTPPAANFGSNSTTSTSYNPPASFVAPFGSVSLACKKGSGATIYTLPITAMTRTAGTGAQTVTVTATAASTLSDCNATLATGNGNGDITGFSISGSDATNGISGTYTLTNSGSQTNSAGSKSFTFSTTVTSSTVVTGTTTITPASPATGTITVTGTPTRSVTRLERTAGGGAGGNTATATATTSAAHGFAVGNSVTIAGAPANSDGSTSQYNGTFSIVNVLADGDGVINKFTYAITTGPATSATGGSAAKGSAVDASTLINWVRGYDNKDDENVNGSLTDVRASIHGDVLHSRPLVINYGGGTGIYVFYGANDGTLRAVKGGQAGTDGNEVWSFVAPEHYTTLGRLYLNSPVIKFPNTSNAITPTPTKRDYFFDGNLGVFQSANLLTTHIFVSMRRGGRSIYALDVSSPTAPKFLWKKSHTDAGADPVDATLGFSELGYTWSEPKVIPIRKTAGVACNPADDTTYRRALVFGAGYDPVQEDKDAGTVRTPSMGRGVFVLNAENGNLIRLLSPPNASVSGIDNATKRYSFPSEITVMDTNGDGCIDRLYAGDTGANLFRFDIDNADETLWKSYKVAALGDIGDNGGEDDRKFLFPPDVVLGFVSNVQVAYVLAGSGDREQPRSTAILDKFFMVKDTIAVGTDPATVTPIKYSDLTQVTIFDNATSNIDPTLAAIKGWRLDYETGEKSVNAPLTVGGNTFFGTNRPLTAAEIAARNSCSPDLGIARGYCVRFMNGTACTNRGENTITRSSLYANLVGGGLPPSPVAGVVQVTQSSGDNAESSVTKTVRFVIGSGGFSTEGSSIEGAKVQASPSSRRQRTFWYFRKDD